jgi:alkylation response protein AidB-like acyl-CoA dehydrogenase
MYSLQLSAEQREIRDTVRDFVTREVRPVALKASRLEAGERRLPTELLATVSRMGLRTLALSEDNGGTGADNLTACIVAEELAAGDVDLAHTLVYTYALAHVLFDRAMNAEQRARFLPDFVEYDDYHLAYAEREPGADTALGAHYHRASAPDPAAKSTARRAAGGEWVVNGVKSVVVNAPLARLFAVRVQTDAGFGTLLVPRDAPGLTVREPQTNRGFYQGICGDVVLEDCKVPAANLLDTRAGDALAADPNGRCIPLRQAMNIGVGRAAYEAALDYAKLRVQGGRRIIEHQAIGTLLAECAISLQVARSAVWQAAWVSDHPEAIEDRSVDDLPLQSIAEVHTAEAMHRVALDAADVFGAMGVMRDMPLTKYVRDALIFLHSRNGVADTKLRIAEAIAGFERG